MDVKISIDKPTRITLVTLGILACGFAWGLRLALAATPMPTFTAGNTLRAADLATMASAINALSAATAPGARIYAMSNGKQYSVNGTYCGQTPPTNGAVTQGTLTGYAAAKAKCETACASPSAHMCSAEEVGRHVAMGGTIPAGQGWVANFAASFDNYPATGSGKVVTCDNDCLGFQASADIACSSSGLSFGAIWSSTYFNTISCSQSAPIYCCD